MPAEILRINPKSPEADALRLASDVLSRGGVVGIPTDTVYGLAADPFNLSAVDEIYRVKGRPDSQALPILVNSVELAAMLVRETPANFVKLAQALWPGALTLIVEASNRLPLKVTANTGRIAVRWPRSEVVTRLIEEFYGPLTGTSANLSGFPPCTSAEQVVKQLGERLPLVLDAGATGTTIASTIVDLRGDDWKILREGAISEREIAAILR